MDSSSKAKGQRKEIELMIKRLAFIQTIHSMHPMEREGPFFLGAKRDAQGKKGKPRRMKKVGKIFPTIV